MTSQHEMRFPFTNREEILNWATRYIEDQSDKRQRQEQAVIDIKENVQARRTRETPGGYLCHDELHRMGRWKHRFVPSKIDENKAGYIKKITAAAFRLDDDWEKLEKLTDIKGVRESVASVILHLYDPAPKKYPILDQNALQSIGIDSRKVKYDEPFWRKYVKFCRKEAKHYGVEMRTLDRALYKLSKADAAAIIKIMPEEMLLTELARRGYDLSKLSDEN